MGQLNPWYYSFQPNFKGIVSYMNNMNIYICESIPWKLHAIITPYITSMITCSGRQLLSCAQVALILVVTRFYHWISFTVIPVSAVLTDCIVVSVYGMVVRCVGAYSHCCRRNKGRVFLQLPRACPRGPHTESYKCDVTRHQVWSRIFRIVIYTHKFLNRGQLKAIY